jgi:hypothetical protein
MNIALQMGAQAVSFLGVIIPPEFTDPLMVG